MIDFTDLQSTTSEILLGIVIGGAHAPIPAAITVVVTLDELAPSVHDPGVAEAATPFPTAAGTPSMPSASEPPLTPPPPQPATC
jgi:hypothetical protein